MSSFMEALKDVCANTYNAGLAANFLAYVTNGEAKDLEKARKALGSSTWQLAWMLRDVWQHLSQPGLLSQQEKRAIHAAIALECARDIADWFKNGVIVNPDDEAAYLAAFVEAFGPDESDRVAAAVAVAELLAEQLATKTGTPSAAGRFLLGLSDQDLAAVGDKAERVTAALQFIVKFAPQRLPVVASSFVREGVGDYRSVSTDACQILLQDDAKVFESVIVAAIACEKWEGSQARALGLLAQHDPMQYQPRAKAINLKILSNDAEWLSGGDVADSFRWLINTYRARVLPELLVYLSSGACNADTVDTLVSELGPAAAPGLVAAARHPLTEVRRKAISSLIDLAEIQHDEVIRLGLQTGLGEHEPDDVVCFVGLAGRWKPGEVSKELWKLFGHKSKAVRLAAARALARIGDNAVQEAAKLMEKGKAAVRSTAVSLLAAAQTPQAAAALEARLDEESDEEIRDQILLALEQVWESQGKKITRREIDRRIERSADKLKAPVAKWINEKKLPPLQYAGKPAGKLAPQAVRYLLYRQSRAKEMRADVEAKPLYKMIDRKTSGEFALAIFNMFCGSGMAAEDRWALSLAGLLGNDRLVAPLMQQIRKWIDGNRGKLAEYAAQALALLGSDVALCAVDALSIRYRSKQKNVGKAAAEAFAEAAERLGISVDELGDRVVPWLGFEPGRARLIEQGDKRIEVRIGTDFKLEFRDLVKDKKIAALPGGLPVAVKTEFKELGATLREVLKGQLSRLENLMVRQYRWPVSRWRELYLGHPLLFPFATRLVWGLYDGDGKLTSLFRSLEDRTLTDEHDDSVELPNDDSGATVGIVHPLELSDDRKQAWKAHLADYNVPSPFLQFERPVVFPTADEQELKFSSKFAGTELNGMTFKGRAERLGWYRGSVTDGGGISFYCKRFPGAGADALLSLEGMYIGIDMYSSIKLERLCFVKTGSVSFGSYVYDEPADAKDERLIPFGKVAPIVFSETLGDLGKIAGNNAAAGEAG